MAEARSNTVKASALCRENSPSFCPHPHRVTFKRSLTDQVDLSGISLTGYDIQSVDLSGTGGDDDEEADLSLRPVGPGGSPAPNALPIYLQELIERLNGIFGEAAPLKDQASFVNQIAAITRENEIVMAQVDKNPKEQALKGNLPGAIQMAVARAMASNNTLASALLKEDRQSLGIMTNLIYDLLKSGGDINLSDLDAT